ncbi:unnamed protein product [Discosporangium mesarthrocarpum]
MSLFSHANSAGCGQCDGTLPAQITAVLEGLLTKICLLRVDDIIAWGAYAEDLVHNLDAVLGRLAERGIFPSGDKVVSYTLEIQWCGKVFTGRTVRHDQARVQGLADLCRPETAGELMQFLQGR